ncbi:MAG: hypothetical protein P8J50_15040 [Acidimicrobiales bacterium]|jgi:hypothetical protein|nr:hypothetical protein [Acidimicrobiales bacterium]
MAKRYLDKVDLVSGPVFIATMLWEARTLRDRPQREMGDLDEWTKDELAFTPDEIVTLNHNATVA